MLAHRPGRGGSLPQSPRTPSDRVPPGLRAWPTAKLMAAPDQGRGLNAKRFARAAGTIGGARTAHGGPQGIRALLRLGPSGAQPHGQPGAAVKTSKAGKPVKAKAKRAPSGPTSQWTRKAASLQAASGNPKGHIQHWLARGVIGVETAPGGARWTLGKSHGQAPETGLSESGRGAGMQPAPWWRSPGIPGSSTDPPPSGHRPGAGNLFSLTPGGQDAGHEGPHGTWRADPGCGWGTQEHRMDGSRSPPREDGFALGAGPTSDDEGTPPRVRFIPDLFVPFPGRGGRQALPRPGRGGAGQLELD